jgi:DNA polymerase-3 subunit beta
MLLPRNLSVIESHADADSSRYALGGIRLERDAQGKPHAIATDGRRLIHVTWDETPDELVAIGDLRHVPGFETILPLGAISAADKAAKLKAAVSSRFPVLNQVLLEEPSANGTVRIASTNMESTSTAELASVEGRFPKWRDVFPMAKTCEQMTISLDPRYLAEMCKAVGALGTHDAKPGINITINTGTGGHKKPILVSAVNHETGIAVEAILMPLYRD